MHTIADETIARYIELNQGVPDNAKIRSIQKRHRALAR